MMHCKNCGKELEHHRVFTYQCPGKRAGSWQWNTYDPDFPDTLSDLEQKRFAWSLKTFPEATSQSSLKKLIEEAGEIEEALLNPDKFTRDELKEEYADALMCLFDSAGRIGISVSDITKAYAEKVEKNQKRKWIKNPDDTYSHIKE